MNANMVFKWLRDPCYAPEAGAVVEESVTDAASNEGKKQQKNDNDAGANDERQPERIAGPSFGGRLKLIHEFAWLIHFGVHQTYS